MAKTAEKVPTLRELYGIKEPVAHEFKALYTNPAHSKIKVEEFQGLWEAKMLEHEKEIRDAIARKWPVHESPFFKMVKKFGLKGGFK